MKDFLFLRSLLDWFLKIENIWYYLSDYHAVNNHECFNQLEVTLVYYFVKSEYAS